MKGDYNVPIIFVEEQAVRDDPHMKGDYNIGVLRAGGPEVRDDPHMKGDYNTQRQRDRLRRGSR